MPITVDQESQCVALQLFFPDHGADGIWNTITSRGHHVGCCQAVLNWMDQSTDMAEGTTYAAEGLSEHAASKERCRVLGDGTVNVYKESGVF